MSNLFFVRELVDLVQRSERDKAQYVSALKSGEKELLAFFNKVNYQYESGPDLYKKPSEARYQDAVNRMNQSKEDYRLGVGECVKYCGDILDKFFKDYYIGRVARIGTNNLGYLEVELHCMLHSGFGDNREAREKQFNEQLNTLKDLGITWSHCSFANSKSIDATENNMNIIKEMLSSRYAKAIQFHIERDSIKTITFCVHPKQMEDFKSNTTKMVEATQKNLTNDQLSIIYKNALEIRDSISFIKEKDDMGNTCCFVAESCFVEICKIIDVDCELRRRFTARFEEERARNAAIRDMDAAVGAAFPAIKFQGTIDHIRSTLLRFGVEKLKCGVHDIVIDRWGTLTVQCRWVPDAEDLIYYCDEEVLSTKSYPTNSDFDGAFETVYIGSQQYLLDTEANRNSLLATVDEIGCTISSFNVMVKNDSYHGMRHVIDKFEVTTDYLSTLIRFYD